MRSPPTLPDDASLLAAARAVAGVEASSGPAHGAWNPLPFRRRAPVALAFTGSTPAAVIADDGARYPAQPLADDTVLIAPELGALAASTFRPSSEPVAGARWEV